jgi:hypothetical protein
VEDDQRHSVSFFGAFGCGLDPTDCLMDGRQCTRHVLLEILPDEDLQPKIYPSLHRALARQSEATEQEIFKDVSGHDM